MKVMIAQLNPTIGDVVGNTEKVLRSMDVARSTGCDLLVTPEMCLCGYAPEDMVLHNSFIEEMENQLDRIVRASKGLHVIVGLIRKNPISEEKDLLNSAAVIGNGKILGFYDKWLLPHYDVFNERRYFSPGRHLGVFEICGKRVAVVICEDMWQNAGVEISGVNYPVDPIKELVPYKPDLLINLTASPFQSRKADVRIEMCQAATKTLKCPLVYACQVGANGMLVFDGYSLFLDGKGRIRTVAKGFQEDWVAIDLEEMPRITEFFPYPLFDLYCALRLGISDYFVKSRQKKATIAISGGLDSALVAVIAVDALGAENVMGIYMPGPFSSVESKEDAKALADNLGICLLEVPITDLYQDFLETLTPLFPHTRNDVTEENLQARIRAVITMAFSNKEGTLVLGTGNKSELALGYCTLYGDMIGALSVIGDVLKTECYTLANWINRDQEIIPRRILSKSPSAELKHHQQDTDTLPPYEIIDQVIRRYVEEYQSLEAIAHETGIPLDIVEDVVRRMYKAEHKRRQAPPSLRVSKKSFAVGRRKPLHFTGLRSEKIH